MYLLLSVVLLAAEEESDAERTHVACIVRASCGSLVITVQTLQVAEVLLQSLQAEGADLKIPHGFGCCFFKDSLAGGERIGR